MKLIGISLRKPSFGELTAAGVMATGLWMATVGVMRSVQFPLERADAGALLLVIVWACVAARMGIRIGMGQRHLAANLVVSAALLGLYQFVLTLAG
jgi:hypothetical protein